MDDVILAHKPRQLNMAAQLTEAQPTGSLGLGCNRRIYSQKNSNPIRCPIGANGLTLTGLLFERRGLGVHYMLGRVGVLNIDDIMFVHDVPAYIATRWFFPYFSLSCAAVNFDFILILINFHFILYYNLLLCFIRLEMHIRLICAVKF